MGIIIGFAVIMGCVLGGFMAMGGHLDVLYQPWELVIIGGAGVGVFLIANPMSTVKDAGKAMGEAFKNDVPHEQDYLETLGVLHSLMSETFDHVSHELIADLRRLFPRAPETEIYWAYHFLTGTFTFSLGQTGRIDALSGGLVSSKDALAIADRLPVTIAAGIRALCDPAGLPPERGG